MGSLGCFAHEVFEFGEDLLDRIKVGAVRRQEQQLGSGIADRLSDGGPFVAPEIIHDDDVARRERGHEAVLDIIGEALTVDRLVQHAWGIDPVTAERCEEGHRAPMTIGHFGMEPLAHRCPPSQRRHVGLRPGLIDEDQASRIKPALIFLPLLAPPGDRGSELFGGQYAFF